MGPLAAADRRRSALLAAVGHDLRRPLSAATAAVARLRSTDVSLSDSDRHELLATADESLASFAALVTNLLDVSRLQAGALAVSIEPVDAADVVLPALDELGLGPDSVELDLPHMLSPMSADAGLLQRVIVNIVANAVRFSPATERVRISASEFANTVEIRIMDRGPGIPVDRRADVFVPFPRLGDTDNLTGLGLAVSTGFVEGMHGTLEAEDTPGGGVTMVIALPVAESAVTAGGS